MQIPSNLLLNKIGKPSIYLPVCMIVWGTISACTAAVQGFGGLLTIRFFLGFVEAPYCKSLICKVTPPVCGRSKSRSSNTSLLYEQTYLTSGTVPGCLYFLTTWYTRKELAFRTALLYSGSLISGAFSGLIAAGITQSLDGAMGMRAWRWLFIIEGVVTILFAFLAIFILPDFPRTTTWLSPDEKALAIWRLDEDIGEDDWVSSEKQSFAYGFVLACKDIKMWLLVCLQTLTLPFPHLTASANE